MSDRHNCEDWCAKCWPMPESAAPSEPLPNRFGGYASAAPSEPVAVDDIAQKLWGYFGRPGREWDEANVTQRCEFLDIAEDVATLYTRTRPAPAPDRVELSDGTFVWLETAGGQRTFYRTPEAFRPINGVSVTERLGWMPLVKATDTGEDFAKVQSFAARVGGQS